MNERSFGVSPYAEGRSTAPREYASHAERSADRGEHLSIDEKAEVLLGGNISPQGGKPKSLIDKYIDDEHPAVQQVLREMMDHDRGIRYFDEDRCAAIAEETGLVGPEYVRAIAIKLAEHLKEPEQ